MKSKIEMEQGLLAGVLLEPSYFKYVEFITENDFTDSNNKKLWAKIESSNVFDPITLTTGEGDEFKKYVFLLYESLPDASNTQEYARLLREVTRTRELSKQLISVIKDIENEKIDVDTAISEINMGIENINSLSLSSISSQEEVVKEVYNELFSNDVKQTYYTGLTMLDANVKFRNANMYVLGASTGIGKSSFAINLAMRISKSNNAKVLFYALEMDKKDVYRKIISNLSNIQDRQLSNESKEFNDDERRLINKATKDLMDDYQIKVHDDYGIDISVLRNQVSELVIKNDLDFVIIDQISLISVKNRFKDERAKLKFISWEIRKLAGELDIPILVLVQLNRQSEEGNASIYHIAESFDIARDSSAIMLLDTDRNDYQDTKQYHLNIVKNRFGKLCSVPLIVNQGTLDYKEGMLYEEDGDVPF